jgi:NADH-quinone oxidoreductase subunit J
MALASAVLMLVMREPMRVALALITTMIMLGGIYGLLGVHFIAAFQVLIYVGAVMVFMVYVIMLLEVHEAPGKARYSRWLVPGVMAFAALVGVLGISVYRSSAEVFSVPGAPPFSLTHFSAAFLSQYWLEFELTSVFLVAAIVAALAVIKVSRRAQSLANGSTPSATPERTNG